MFRSLTKKREESVMNSDWGEASVKHTVTRSWTAILAAMVVFVFAAIIVGGIVRILS